MYDLYKVESKSKIRLKLYPHINNFMKITCVQTIIIIRASSNSSNLKILNNRKQTSLKYLFKINRVK